MNDFNSLLQEFVSSGLAVDVVLAVLAIELFVLWRKGWKIAEALLLLLPAAFILIALRAALLDAHWLWIVVPLAFAFPAHLADIRLRKQKG